MVMPNLIPGRDGSERTRLRRAIGEMGVEPVAKFIGLSRATVLGYAGGAGVQLASETVIVVRLQALEAEVEATRRRTG